MEGDPVKRAVFLLVTVLHAERSRRLWADHAQEMKLSFLSEDPQRCGLIHSSLAKAPAPNSNPDQAASA